MAKIQGSASPWRTGVLGLVLGLAMWSQAATAAVVQLTSPGQIAGMASTQVDWGTLGPDGTDAGATPTVGPATASGPAAFAALQQAPTGSFDADFADGDSLLGMFDLVNGNATSGTITVTLTNAVAGFAFQLANGLLFQAFAVTIDAYDAANSLLGSFVYNHTSTDARDGSALFVGILSGASEITRFTVAGLSEGSAIGDITLLMIPVPGSAALALVALLVLGLRRRG